MRRALAPAISMAILFGVLSSPTYAAAPPHSAQTPPTAPCSATDDAIYTPPKELPGSAGDVLACTSTKLPKVPGDIPMKAWKLQYQSENVHQEKVAISGFLAVPEKPWHGNGPRPVVAFNHGTLGLGTKCAYSKQMSGAFIDAYEQQQIAAILQAGYAVVATDGMGFLNGQSPTYMLGQNAGRALLDSARAASRLPGSGLDARAPVALWGYSEGGQSSLWGAQLAASYAPELPIVGAAAGGVPGDLRLIGPHLNGSQFSGLAAAALVGSHNAYPDMPFDELLNDAGRKAVSELKQSCLIDTLFGFANKKVQDFTKDHLNFKQIFNIAGPDGTTWGQIAGAQKVGVQIGTPDSAAKYKIGFPVFQYRGEREQIIPIETEEQTRTAYCQAKIPTQWKVYPGDDHLVAAGTAVPDVIAWIKGRLNGAPAPTNCTG